MMEKEAKWIWYPGDYEIYHSSLVNTRREERDFFWPAFWRLDDAWHNVRFKNRFFIEKDTVIYCKTNGRGYVQIDDMKQAIVERVHISAGEHEICFAIFKNDGLPSILVEGEDIRSDSSWLVDCCDGNWKPVGFNEFHKTKLDNPEIFPMQYRSIEPVKIVIDKNGTLYDFGKITFAAIYLTNLSEEETLGVYYGEWEKEALDTEFCYLQDQIKVTKNEYLISAKAFRYVYITYSGTYSLDVKYEYLHLEKKGNFSCNEQRMNAIWDTAEYTFHLNSREFFLDGIKRDRWIWSGDAYQSYQINNYVYFNQELTKRTILALRGKDPVTMHINTIPDYSFYWLMSVYEYYQTTLDTDFVAMVYESMKSLMDFCISRTNPLGFIEKVGEDWIFIDWAEIDKEGAVCAEQMLYVKSLEATAACAKILNDDSGYYEELAAGMRVKIQEYFWCEEKGAFIDSYQSGKENVTRHANIFAILFGFANQSQQEKIVKKVILNHEIPEIKTPYFKFYELDLMGHIGELNYVKEQIQDYWGGMLDLGATTFWEEYDPDLSLDRQYEMYDNPYGKSFCHAWGASPIYLIGKYFLGIKMEKAGYHSFSVEPEIQYFKSVNAQIPIMDGWVNISWDSEKLMVTVTRDGGFLNYEGSTYELVANELFTIAIKGNGYINSQ